MKKNIIQFIYIITIPLSLAGCNNKTDEQPNILFIMSDDHTSQAWGVYGGILEDYVHTPNDWRKYGYYRYWQHQKYRPGHFGIRGKRYKLAFFYGNGFKDNKNNESEKVVRYWDFFDLKEDPNELHNAYEDEQYQEIIKEMKNQILHQREILGDRDEENPEILEIIKEHWN